MRRKKLFDNLKNYDDEAIIIKSSKKHHNKKEEDERARGSEFKGVSRNGKSW